ncbi:MAG: ATP-binding protein [Acidobacteriota bacterium]
MGKEVGVLRERRGILRRLRLVPARTTLRLRFTLAIVGTILGVASTLGAYFHYQQTRAADEALRSRAVSLATSLAYNSEYGVFVANRALLRRYGQGVLREPDVEYVLIEDRQGNLLAYLGDHGPPLASASAGSSTLQEFPRFEEFVDGNGTHLLQATVPILLQSQDDVGGEIFLSDEAHPEAERWIGIVRVGLSREPSRRRVAALHRTTLLLTVAISVLGVLAAVLFVRRIVEPLKILLLGTQRIAEGDLIHRVEINADDEIGELADSFNRMTGDLQRARDELEAYSTELERKVRERTRKLEEAQNQLLQSEKLSAIGKLVAGVAHELNNPLTGVLGYAQLLLRRKTEKETARSLERIAIEAIRCKKIVQNLLAFARKQKAERLPINVNNAIERTLALRAYPMKLDNIEIVTDLQTGLPRVLGDFNQLQQVFLNMIINAHQAMIETKRPGRLVVRTQEYEGHVQIEIKDNGSGIPAAVKEHIFDPFFTTKEVGSGTGLGLSICYGIVQEHGGRILVDSEEGKGSRFIVEVPVLVEEGNDAGPSQERAPEPAARRVGTEREDDDRQVLQVLIVDDEISVLEILHQALEQEGFLIEHACNGDEALEKIIKRKPDLIISDLRMPGMSGVELYSRVKAMDPILASRMVFVTGDTVSSETQEFLEQSGNACIEKPFDLDEVNSLLRERAEEVRGARVLVG